MSSSALTILTADHRSIEALFVRFEKLTDRAVKGRADLVAQIARELSLHAAVEEQVFYPRMREEGTKARDEVLEGLEEHHVIKELLSGLLAMDADDERYEAKATVLFEQVRHHVKEEEGELFPRAKRVLSSAQLSELGDAIVAARATAPTRPHPSAPDEGAGQLTNRVVASIDAARDAGSAAIEATGHVVREARRAVTKDR